MPFVTEAKRLIILIPITFQTRKQTTFFLDRWFDTNRKPNTVAILILLVVSPEADEKLSQSQSLLPKHVEEIKSLVNQYNARPPVPPAANRTSSNSATEGPKVGYVVVNLNTPPASSSPDLHFKLGILDQLGKRVLVPNSLVLLLKPNVNINDDFLNRVRMNTIPNSQVYSPIPFVEYIPSVAYYMTKRKYKVPKELEINKVSGYFNSEEYEIISFYYGDYISGK
jgi:hypothetical protein